MSTRTNVLHEQLNPQTEEELLKRALPKWPQMLTTGVTVTIEQAKEIIRRTDTFFQWHGHGGNDHAYDRRVCELFGLPFWADEIDKHRDKPAPLEELRAEERSWKTFLEKWGLIYTGYVSNGWISEAFIGGPHGWCHPDGTIGYVDNVGKWPSCTAIYEEWKQLAEAFPFLDIGVTLMSGEECEEERKPVISFVIHGGHVDVVDPTVRDVHAQHAKLKERNMELDMYKLVLTPANQREHGIPWEWIEEWHDKFVKE